MAQGSLCEGKTHTSVSAFAAVPKPPPHALQGLHRRGRSTRDIWRKDRILAPKRWHARTEQRERSISADRTQARTKEGERER